MAFCHRPSFCLEYATSPFQDAEIALWIMDGLEGCSAIAPASIPVLFKSQLWPSTQPPPNFVASAFNSDPDAMSTSAHPYRQPAQFDSGTAQTPGSVVARPSRLLGIAWSSGAVCSRWSRDRGREFTIMDSRKRSLTSSPASAKCAGVKNEENFQHARSPVISFMSRPSCHIWKSTLETGAVSMGCRAQHRAPPVVINLPDDTWP